MSGTVRLQSVTTAKENAFVKVVLYIGVTESARDMYCRRKQLQAMADSLGGLTGFPAASVAVSQNGSLLFRGT